MRVDGAFAAATVTGVAFDRSPATGKLGAAIPCNAADRSSLANDLVLIALSERHSGANQIRQFTSRQDAVATASLGADFWH